jgi:hypothetical protein
MTTPNEMKLVSLVFCLLVARADTKADEAADGAGQSGEVLRCIKFTS